MNNMDIMPFAMAPPAETPFPFLQLPAEIRNMIYFLLLAGRTITLGIPHSFPIRYFAVRCRRFLPAVLKRYPEPEIRHIDRSSFLHRDRVTIGLLGTCRQIYKETCAIPYIFNTFSIHSGLLSLWLERRMYAQLQVIRSLKLTGHVYSVMDSNSFLTTMNEAARLLTGLGELDVTIAMNAHLAIRGQEASWLRGVEAFLGRSVRGRLEVNPVSGPARWRWRRFGGEEGVRRLNERWGG